MLLMQPQLPQPALPALRPRRCPPRQRSAVRRSRRRMLEPLLTPSSASGARKSCGSCTSSGSALKSRAPSSSALSCVTPSCCGRRLRVSLAMRGECVCVCEHCTDPETGECSNPVIARLVQNDDFNAKLEAYRASTQAGVSIVTAALYWGSPVGVARRVSIRSVECASRSSAALGCSQVYEQLKPKSIKRQLADQMALLQQFMILLCSSTRPTVDFVNSMFLTFNGGNTQPEDITKLRQQHRDLAAPALEAARARFESEGRVDLDDPDDLDELNPRVGNVAPEFLDYLTSPSRQPAAGVLPVAAPAWQPAGGFLLAAVPVS